jgi:imidazole glycerol-phosphate synthase subunit HisF
LRTRVIPVLLLHKGGLIKSVKFKNYKYIGDPINAVKIFNEKEVDELILLDIDATRDNRGPKTNPIADIVSEAFMPIAYGGGITTIEQIKELLFNGVEKVILNKTATLNTALITKAATQFGNQSVVVSIDYKKALFGGNKIYTDNGTKSISINIIEYAKQMESAGAGELMLNSIERDGTYSGYDIDIIQQVAKAVSIPIIACGGAGNVDDFVMAKKSGASAVAAGSMFVFQRPHQAVLISYPTPDELKEKLFNI